MDLARYPLTPRQDAMIAAISFAIVCAVIALGAIVADGYLT